jgi:diamine N-acetyltransferase
MIQLRDLSIADMDEIRGWPPYPPEFSDLDYALRHNGWLDDFGGRPDTWCYAGEDAGELIAFVILSKTGGCEAEFRLALRADRIGQGVGAAIIPMALERATGMGVTRIHLIVRKTNPRACRLYTRMGFEKRGECSREINGKRVLFTLMDLLIKRRKG